jgi:hypothetical protein
MKRIQGKRKKKKNRKASKQSFKNSKSITRKIKHNPKTDIQINQ